MTNLDWAVPTAVATLSIAFAALMYSVSVKVQTLQWWLKGISIAACLGTAVACTFALLCFVGTCPPQVEECVEGSWRLIVCSFSPAAVTDIWMLLGTILVGGLVFVVGVAEQLRTWRQKQFEEKLVDAIHALARDGRFNDLCDDEENKGEPQ